jgi:Xaa-Pro dipeptidase
MAKSARAQAPIRAEDIDPRYNWGARCRPRHHGRRFEERVDYRRLHRYRLARPPGAREVRTSALLVMDVNNIRYLTSTKIGEWERDKICRWALLTRAAPIRSCGTSARPPCHHRLYAPWLKPENCKAGLLGLRGTSIPPSG